MNSNSNKYNRQALYQFTVVTSFRRWEGSLTSSSVLWRWARPVCVRLRGGVGVVVGRLVCSILGLLEIRSARLILEIGTGSLLLVRAEARPTLRLEALWPCFQTPLGVRQGRRLLQMLNKRSTTTPRWLMRPSWSMTLVSSTTGLSLVSSFKSLLDYFCFVVGRRQFTVPFFLAIIRRSRSQKCRVRTDCHRKNEIHSHDFWEVSVFHSTPLHVPISASFLVIPAVDLTHDN